MNFGERLRQIRRDRGVSQRHLAVQAGVDFTYISKIEQGHMLPPGEETLGKIVAALDAEELFFLAGKVPHELKRQIIDNPKLCELLIILSKKRLPDETYQETILLARKQDYQEGN